MPKKFYAISEITNQKSIQEGRGAGQGCDHKPWLTDRHLPSEWRSHRIFGHKSQICDPWHYVPVLEKKPSAVRDRILKQDKGDRAFVDRLSMARELGDGGLDALEVACDLTLQTGVMSAAIVLNEMRRLTEASLPKAPVDTLASTSSLTLEPVAYCSGYDSLQSLRHVH
jgi:hypothetical protein